MSNKVREEDTCIFCGRRISPRNSSSDTAAMGSIKMCDECLDRIFSQYGNNNDDD